jgi:hypothetical protein
VLRGSAFPVRGDPVFDFSTAGVADWERRTGAPSPCSWGLEDEAAAGQRVLRVQTAGVQGEEVLISPMLGNPFGTDGRLTVFAARGSDTSTRLAFTWVERDSSTWTAVVTLEPGYRLYALRPGDFRWSGGDAGRRDGGFDPSRAERLVCGLSWRDTGQIQGPQEYAVAWIATDRGSAWYEGLYGVDPVPPDLDTLSPPYKLFPMTGVAGLRTHPNQAWPARTSFPVPGRLRSPHQRPQAHGFDKGREWRWIPLLEGRTETGDWRGTPATLVIHTPSEYAGSAWASFGVADPDWYRQPAVLDLIGQVAQRIRTGVFILDAGADLYTYRQGEPVRLGFRLLPLGSAAGTELTARIKLVDQETQAVVTTRSWPVEPDAGRVTVVQDSWHPTVWPDAGYRVEAELVQDGTVIDRAQHDIHPWVPDEEPSFVQVRDGRFVLNDRPWRAHGVNYHPSSTVATVDWNLFLEWFGRRSYDPEVIDRDLSRIVGMGLNSVSVQVWHSQVLKYDNLLDFLRRLDRHGLKANLAMPLSPLLELDDRWTRYRRMVEELDLASVDAVFAYDIDWEPVWHGAEYRARWDREWAEWIVERYGSVENAERHWGVPAPRNAAGEITGPPVQQLQRDGEWRRMGAAYLRFLNTLLFRHYGRARDLIREVDPNHLVSFRMHASGDGGSGWYGLLPYDWPYLAAAVDFLGPEAYTLGKTWDDSVRRGVFTRAYANWAGPGKPMVYTESGYNLIEYPGDPGIRSGAMERQARYYRDFYRMMTAAGVDGVFWWWFPGGYRCLENSDYGVVSPDGSDRPVTRVIREHAERMRDPAPELTPGPVLEAEPDALLSSSQAGSLYKQVEDRFWTEVGHGRLPALRTAGTGTDSVTCPAVAVGLGTWDPNRPPAYLDAAFRTVEVLDGDGQWYGVRNGDPVAPGNGRALTLRFTLTNLGEAAWVAGDPDERGVVALVVDGQVSRRVPLPQRVPHLGSVGVGPLVLPSGDLRDADRLVLFLEAGGRTAFGERFVLVLDAGGETK